MMSDKKEVSPLYPIRRTCIMLRLILGFPLQSKNNTFIEFKFVKWFEYIRFSMLILITLIHPINILTMVLMVDNGQTSDFFITVQNMTEAYSIGQLDISCAIAIPIISLISSVCYIWCFGNNAKSISTMCRKISEVKLMLLDFQSKEKTKLTSSQQGCKYGNRKSERLALYGQFFNILGAFLFTVHVYNCVSNPSQEKLETLPLTRYIDQDHLKFRVITANITVIFVIFSPLAASSEVLVCQTIDFVKDLFKEWTELVRVKTIFQTYVPVPENEIVALEISPENTSRNSSKM